MRLAMGEAQFASSRAKVRGRRDRSFWCSFMLGCAGWCEEVG